MLRTSRCRLVFMVVVLTLCVVQSSVAAKNSSGRLVSPELLRHAKLAILWENTLPIKKTEKLEQLLLLGNRLYAVSSSNYMVALDKDAGTMVFSRAVAPAGFPVAGLKLYGNELLSVGGSKLTEIDAGSGDELRVMDVGFGITCPAARNSSYFYIAGVDNRLHVFRAGDRVQTFEVAADNNSTITSITADDNLVVFATAAGNVIGIAPGGPTRLWQFDASETIAGPIVKDWMSLFFASKDTNVYRVDIVGLPEKKRLVWKNQTAAVLEEAPRVTQEVVYQHVSGKGVAAIDKETGSSLWLVPGGVDLLAESGGRAYVITKAETLVVMDNTKGKRLYSVNFAGVSIHASNIGDGKIYIADKRGRVACLQPVE
ncbi:MAG: outer membrane protein assembly factor BamB family protein [Planctomycetota bacterium]